MVCNKTSGRGAKDHYQRLDAFLMFVAQTSRVSVDFFRVCRFIFTVIKNTPKQ